VRFVRLACAVITTVIDKNSEDLRNASARSCRAPGLDLFLNTMKLAWLLLLALIATAAVHRVVAEEDDAESYVEADEDYQEADRAHLVVRKYFKNEAQGVHEGVQGRNLTVYIDLYNAGTRFVA
jgi:hypothetical protein